jgi:hypothetical protein
VISNPAHDEGHSIQQYVIKFVSDLRHVGGFLRVLRCLPSIQKLYDFCDISPQLIYLSSNLVINTLLYSIYSIQFYLGAVVIVIVW